MLGEGRGSYECGESVLWLKIRFYRPTVCFPTLACTEKKPTMNACARDNGETSHGDNINLIVFFSSGWLAAHCFAMSVKGEIHRLRTMERFTFTQNARWHLLYGLDAYLQHALIN